MIVLYTFWLMLFSLLLALLVVPCNFNENLDSYNRAD